jgi:parallel beta-helix repeat protein
VIRRKVIKMNAKRGIFFVGIALLVFCAFVGTASAADIYVPDNHTKIQWAVDNASAGDTIFVRDGTYTENVDVNKRLTIRSENGSASTIIQAESSDDHVFEVTVDYVDISGFTVQDTTGTYKAGIYLNNADHCTISENTASNNYAGIYLNSSSTNYLTGNTASNNYAGIYLNSSSTNYLTGNTASNNYDGIDLFDSSTNYLTGNTASNNYDGIDLVWCTNNILTGNTASDNDEGIRLYLSSNNLIFHNNLVNNTNNAEDHNTANNDWHHPVLLEGNYWSDYTGVDDGCGTGKHAIAGDGIGDTDIPHPADDFDFYPFMTLSLWDNTEVSMETATGSGTVVLSTSDGYFADSFCMNESDLPDEGKPPLEFPHGFFCFKVAGLEPGQTIYITLTLPLPVPPDSQYWICQDGEWYPIPIESNDGDNVIIIQLTDGGTGDEDEKENCVIVEPGGLGNPREVAAKVPALTPLGILALIGVLSIVLALSIKRRRKRG